MIRCPNAYHAALKADPIAWERGTDPLRRGDFQTDPDTGEIAAELRNCARCRTTLAIEIAPKEAA